MRTTFLLAVLTPILALGASLQRGPGAPTLAGLLAQAPKAPAPAPAPKAPAKDEDEDEDEPPVKATPTTGKPEDKKDDNPPTASDRAYRLSATSDNCPNEPARSSPEIRLPTTFPPRPTVTTIRLVIMNTTDSET